MNAAYSAPPEVGRWQQRALIVGVVFTLLFAVGAFLDRAQFFHSYLVAYLFWTGIALGSLAILLLQHLTGGAWGLVIRRILEAATRTIPLMAVLFVPIILGAHQIYPWTHHEEMSKTPALEQKARLYLNLPFFSGRAALYFAIWILTAYLLNKWSQEQDRTADRRFTKRMRMTSAPGLLLFVLTVTFASVDWAMSLNPDWFSTIYGLLFVIAWALSALALAIAAMSFLTSREPMSRIVRPNHFQDLGKLMLAFVMLWAYFAFSQFLIVWYGNLPEEIQWYLPRLRGGWGVIAVGVILFHFAFPFLLLLSASLKRNPRKLVMLAGLILLMRFIDLFWMIAPEFTPESFHVSWMDVVAPIAMGGFWLAMFAWQLRKRSLMPTNDPQYDSLLAQAQAPAHAEH
ncbi:MAG: hypothetical protein H0U18_04180 [Pyrinomonadaceae bacterium]|jgi:hypothetical protein|nr:hypothetical protein [Pyrinomonadaceae bacterium]